jgi:hypothetical protein
MSSVYSKRFIALGNGSARLDVYVPTGFVWIIDHCQLNHESGGAGESASIVVADLYALVSSAWPIYSGASVMRYDGRFVAYQGEKLSIWPVSGRWSGFACGYELTA